MYQFFRTALFLLDAELAHRLVCGILRMLCIFPPALRAMAGARQTQPRTVAGMAFSNPVGLAAGFDKDAKLLRALPDLGFGFAEVGTVTLYPQGGNRKPRLFRIPKESALFNCMGFNSMGAGSVAERIRKAKPHLPQDFRVGVNIGKNKDTLAQDAADEHAVCASFFEGLADFFVINLSSPNTPGLRDLQNSEMVFQIFSRVRQVISRWKHVPPIFLKLSPELAEEELVYFCQNASRLGIDGFVLTNTLKVERFEKSGGLSGAPLLEKSRQSLKTAREHYKGPIISVGGIMNGGEAKQRFELGADLAEVYSGWIYRGPSFANEILDFLKD